MFGPVVAVQSFTHEAQAIAMANDVDYSLAASLLTEDTGRALGVSDALDFGTVWVYRHLSLASEMPWGGFGMSGQGRDLSTNVRTTTHVSKHVMLATRTTAST